MEREIHQEKEGAEGKPSDNAVSDNVVSGNAVTDNIVSDNAMSGNGVSDNVVAFVPDDEEYSYSGYGYSGEGKNVLGETDSLTNNSSPRTVAFIPDDEEYSYSGYGEQAATSSMGYGDYIVEEFSTEKIAPKFSHFTRLPFEVTTYIFAVIYVVFGIFCVGFTDIVMSIFPYIVGGVMIAYGGTKLVVGIVRKEYLSEKTNETVSSAIFVAVGIMIIVEDYDWDMVFISVVWGILGLMEGAHAFKRAITKMVAAQPCVYYMMKGCIEVILAFLLLHDFDHISVHIIVFGIQLIFDGITSLPQVRRIRHYF
jgi:uncharacterized membrane protein HdeD (DUF308 family)